MPLADINWNPEPRHLRQFAWVLMIGFTLIAWVVWWYEGNFQASRDAGRLVWGSLPYLWGIPLGIGLISLIHRRIAKPFYLVWMGFAFVMGTVLSFLLLVIFFYLIITPLGLILRLFGHDPLRLRRFDQHTNWVDHAKPTTRESCERLF